MPIDIIDNRLVFTGVNGMIALHRGGISNEALLTLAVAIENGNDYEMENSRYKIEFYGGDMSVNDRIRTIYLRPEYCHAATIRCYVKQVFYRDHECVLFCVVYFTHLI